MTSRDKGFARIDFFSADRPYLKIQNAGVQLPPHFQVLKGLHLLDSVDDNPILILLAHQVGLSISRRFEVRNKE